MIRLGVVGYGSRVQGMIGLCMRLVNQDVHIAGVVDSDERAARRRLEDYEFGRLLDGGEQFVARHKAADHSLREPAPDNCDRHAPFFKSLDDMLRHVKLDGLAIGTPDNVHTCYAVEAAKYDLPLFLEKPVATTMEQALALENAFENSRCPVVVSFPLRFTPLCKLAGKLIDDGAVGHPEHIEAVNFVPYGHIYFDGTYRSYEVSGGLFLQKATHDFDYMSHLMGSDIIRVGAMASWARVWGGDKPAGLVCSECDETQTCPESPQNRIRNRSTNKGLTDHACPFSSDLGSRERGINEDSSNALLEFASGAIGVYSQVFFSRRDAARRGLTVTGYEGTISFDFYKDELTRVRHHEPFTDRIRLGSGGDNRTAFHFGGDTELARNFLDVVQGRDESRASIWSGIRSVYACLAAKQSAEEGRFVEVRQVGSATGVGNTCPACP